MPFRLLMCNLPDKCMLQTRLIRTSFNKLLACFPRKASFPATKISIKINPSSKKKKVVKFSLKYFRNLISRLSWGVWKQPESLSPEGRPKTGSLNQCQQCASIRVPMGTKQEWSMFSESIKAPVRGVSMLITHSSRKTLSKSAKNEAMRCEQVPSTKWHAVHNSNYDIYAHYTQ